MDAGLVAALAGARDAGLAALEVDEMHVPHVADAVDPAVIVLLNLSRDQLDRVGEINHIERTLRAGLARHPTTVVVANCDDVLMTSAAYDSPNVVWVAAGGGWAGDSVSCPRSGEIIVRRAHRLVLAPAPTSSAPAPQWWFDDDNIYGPDGLSLPMTLALPGTVNRGNATQAVAAAVALGADPAAAVAAVSGVDEVAGRYRTVQVGAHTVRMLLAKNPGGLAGGAVDGGQARRGRGDRGQRPGARRRGPVLAVGCPLRALRRHPVVAAGERGTDLAVRLGYAGVEHTLVHDTVAAIASCPPGHVEVLANYTAFLQLQPGAGSDVAESTVRIGLVLPDVMGTYGDGGNAVVLRQRLRLRGIDAEIVEITLSDPVPDSLDLYTLGGAEDYAQRLATKHLTATRACSGPPSAAHRCWRSARPSRCSGTGTRRRRVNASTASGCWTSRRHRRTKRTIGEVVVAAAARRARPSALTGFENHRGGTVLGPRPSRLAR